MKTLADLKKTLIPFATLRVSGAQLAWLSPESPLVLRYACSILPG